MENYNLLVYIVAGAAVLVIYVVLYVKLRNAEQEKDALTTKHAKEVGQLKEEHAGKAEALTKQIDNTEEAKLLRSQLGGLKEQMAEATKTLVKAAELKEWLKNYPAFDADRQEMDRKLSELAHELPLKMAQFAELSQKATDLAAEIARLESERSQFTAELDGLRKEVEDAKAQLKKLQDEVEKLTQLRQELTKVVGDLEEERVRLERTVKNHEGKIEELEKKIKEFEEEKHKLGDRIKELENKIEKLG